MNMKVRVSNEAFTDKQTAVDKTSRFKVGSKTNVMDMNLTIQEIAEKWVAGHSILPARMRRGRSDDAHWAGQQVYAIDFDNENGDKERVSDDYYITPGQALEMAQQAGLRPAFIYSSFSSTAEHQKFRMVFVLHEEVKTKRLHVEVVTSLYSVFMKGGYIVADTQCRDLSRIYYGGKELLHQDYAAVINLQQVMQLGSSNAQSISRLRSKRDHEGTRMNDYIPTSQIRSDTVRGLTTSAMEALVAGDPNRLRECLHNGLDSTLAKIKNTCTVCANMNPYELIKRLPLHDILGVPLNTSFRCIMFGHEDNHPSASVIRIKDGTFAYFCHGCYGQGVGRSLIDLITDAVGCSVADTVSFCETAFDIAIKTEHQRVCHARCESILDFIYSPGFRTGKWEPLYSYLHRKRLLSHYGYYLERAIEYAAPEPMVDHGIPAFFESVRETREQMLVIPHCTGVDKDSICRKRNELVDLGLLGKVTNLQHPAFAKAKAHQKRVGNLHHKEFLYIPELSEDILQNALSMTIETKRRGERSRYKSRASILTSRSIEEADKIYRQDTGKELTSYQLGFIGFMRRAAQSLTREKGWTTEDELVEEIKRTSKFSGVKYRVGQFRPLLTNGEMYTLKRVTKDMQIKMNLPDSMHVRTNIILRVQANNIEALVDQIFSDTDDQSVISEESKALPTAPEGPAGMTTPAPRHSA